MLVDVLSGRIKLSFQLVIQERIIPALAFRLSLTVFVTIQLGLDCFDDRFLNANGRRLTEFGCNQS